MTIFNRQWWTLKRTLPLLVLLAGALVIFANYLVAMQYVDAIESDLDPDLTAEIMRRHVRELAVMSTLIVIVVASVYGYLISRIVTKPVSRLADAANALKTGQYDVSAHLKQVNELGEISVALDSLAIRAQAGQDTLSLNARLIDIVEHSANEVYVADASTYRILSVNRIARERHGLKSGALPGRYPWSFLPDIDVTELKNRLRSLHDGDHVKQVFDSSFIDRKGRVYDVELTLQLLDSTPPPVILIIAKDTQAFLQQYKDLQLRNKAMDALDVGIAITDASQPGYPLVYVNKGWCKLTGYDAQEIIGRPVRELQRADKNQPAHGMIDQAQSNGKSVQVLLTSTRKDGSKFMDELCLSPVRNSTGDLTHYIGVHRDVTTVLETQRQLQNIHRLESVGLLSGGIAHDFNNLLAVIQGNLEFLRDLTDDPLQEEYLQEAENASNMGARLTKRLLTFARRSSLKATSLDVNAQVLDAVELLRSAVGESITLSTSLAVDLWPIYSDQSQLENAIINLTLNARDAIAHHGKILLQTDNETLYDTLDSDVSDIPNGDYVCLRVTDDGCGMSADIQSRVLEPFFTTKDSDKGTGLGLSTIYGFIKQTGGHLRISSEPGRGSTFSLYFPRYLEQSRVVTDKQEPEGSSKKASEASILVVDDNASVRKVTVARLHALGHQTREATGSAEAIRLISEAKAAGAAFDFVITDVVMDSHSSGFTIADWVRTHDSGCTVILTSAYSDMRPAEADELPYLQKPYSLEQLQHVLESCTAK